MQIIEMYEPDEDLKKQGKKSEKKENFSLFKKFKSVCNFKILAFLVKCIFKMLWSSLETRIDN